MTPWMESVRRGRYNLRADALAGTLADDDRFDGMDRGIGFGSYHGDQSFDVCCKSRRNSSPDDSICSSDGDYS